MNVTVTSSSPASGQTRRDTAWVKIPSRSPNLLESTTTFGQSSFMRLPGFSPKVMESGCSVPSVKSVRGSNEESAGASGSISAVTLRSLMKCARNPVGAFTSGRLAISFPYVSLKLSIVPAKTPG